MSDLATIMPKWIIGQNFVKTIVTAYQAFSTVTVTVIYTECNSIVI